MTCVMCYPGTDYGFEFQTVIHERHLNMGPLFQCKGGLELCADGACDGIVSAAIRLADRWQEVKS